ncbi:MAG: YCF48-related protein [Ignavibacteria bacterium]|nr:YCF48-related protein [Ignavibacteria bacterium]
MKKVIYILLFMVLCSPVIINGQWISQHPNAGYSFHHVAFVNRWTGWVCGDGVIKKTTNGGENWIEQTHQAAGKYLYCIFPVDSNIVYCVGYWQTILKTTNGGENWWITGSGFTILKTFDGGNSFDSISTSPIFASFLYDIRFKDAMTGIMCGVGGQVKRTTNGGYNWHNVNIPLNDTLSDFIKMSVIGNQHCYLAGGCGRIFYTNDFGDNWINVGKIQCPPQSLIYCCFFANLLTGWAGGEFGILYKSTNGGYNWLPENTNNDQRYIQSLWFNDTLVGWAVGGGGKVLHTTSGGQTHITLTSNEVFPGNFELMQNYPNPFNSETKISFSIPSSEGYGFSRRVGLARLTVFDISGREIETLVNKQLSPGTYSVIWNAADFPSGVYFCRLQSGSSVSVKKMVLIK